MQFSSIHDNTSPLIIGGIGLSLLGLLSFGLNRVVTALKRRKDKLVPHYNSSSSRAMICAPASGVGRAAIAKPARAKRTETVAEAEPAKLKKAADSGKPKQLAITGVFKIVGRIKRPAVDDQLVYLDE